MSKQDKADAMSEMDLFHAVSNTSEGGRFPENDVTRDPRTGRIITDGLRDDALVVTFTTEPVFSKLETYKAGGEPRYVQMDFITITIPGDRDTTVHTPVTDYYQWRFPTEYAAFKAGQQGIVNGTPLTEWSAITPAQVKELAFHGINTVEQIANLSDGVSGVLRAFYAMKAKAKLFLEQRSKFAAANDVQVLLDEQNAKHTAELDAMKAQIAALMSALQGETKTRGK